MPQPFMPPKYTRTKKRPYTKFPKKTTKYMKPTYQTKLYSKVSEYHHFKRTFEKFNFPLTGTSWGSGYAFRINELPNFAEFQNLFEQYRIDGVKIKLFYTIDANNVNTSTNGFLMYFSDYNDASNPVSINEFYEADAKQLTFTQCNGYGKSSIYLKPKVAQEIYRSAVTTTYATPRNNPFLDFTTSDTPHFGWKLGYAGGANCGNIRGIVTFYFTCRYLK